jgi:hypothetical protein
MNLIVVLFGGFAVAMAFAILVAPVQVTGAILAWQTRSRFYAAILVRVVVGALFLLAAPETRYPVAVYVIGGLMILTGVVIAAMGQQRMDAMIERMVPKNSGVVRVYALVGMLFGGFLIYAGL